MRDLVSTPVTLEATEIGLPSRAVPARAPTQAREARRERRRRLRRRRERA